MPPLGNPKTTPYPALGRQAHLVRAGIWLMGLGSLALGQALGALQLALAGYLAAAVCAVSSLALWRWAPRAGRSVLWLLVLMDLAAVTLLVAQSGYHHSPLYIWYLAPLLTIGLLGGMAEAALALGLGAAAYLGLLFWGQSVGGQIHQWLPILWRLGYVLGFGALLVALLSRRSHDLLTGGDPRERLQLILQQVTDGYYETDLRGRFTFCNQALARNFGYPDANSLVGLDSRSTMDQDTWREVRQKFNQVFKGGQPIERLQYRLIRPSGEHRHIEISASLILGRRGQPSGFRGICRDITEERHAAKALAVSEAKYRSLFNMHADGCVLLTLDGRFLEANQAVCQLWGARREQIIGATPWAFSPPEQPDGRDSRKAAEVEIERALESGRQNFSWVHRSRDGKDINCEVTLMPVELKHEPPVVMAVVRDVTERKAMLAELAQSREQYRQLYESAQRDEQVMRSLLSATGEPVIIFDDRGQVRFVNQAFSQVFGWSENEVKGRPLPFVPDDLAAEHQRQQQSLLEGQPIVDLRTRRLTKDGRELHVSLSSSAILGDQGRVAETLVIARDITAQVEAENQLKRINQELADSREQYRELFESAQRDEQALRSLLAGTGDPVVIYDPAGNVSFVNAAFSQVFGWSSDEIIGRRIEYLPEDERGRGGGEPGLLIQDGNTFTSLQGRRWTKDGRLLNVRISASSIVNEEGKVLETLVLLHDVTEQVESAQAMRRMYEMQKDLAQRDSLTGLYNHGYMQQALEQEITRCLAEYRPLTVMLLDLDKFKELNDLHGHLVGDEALKLVAGVLSRNCRKGDYAGRWGGDEFMLILPDSGGRQALGVANRLREDLAANPLNLENGSPVTVEASLGVAVFPLDSAVKDRLVAMADGAMYLAKRMPEPNSVRLAADSTLVANRPPGIEVLQDLVWLVDEWDGVSAQMSEEASFYTERLTEAMVDDPREKRDLMQAAQVHNVGGIAIPGEWLRPGVQLESWQRNVLHHLPTFSVILMRQLSDLGLRPQEAVAHHREYFDGSGFPRGLAGEEIPRPARLLSVVVTFCRLRAEDGLSTGQAAARLQEMAGKQLDPEITQVFLERCLEPDPTAATGNI